MISIIENRNKSLAVFHTALIGAILMTASAMFALSNQTTAYAELEQTPFPPPIIGGQEDSPEYTIVIPHSTSDSYTYEPEEVGVPVGTTIMWINKDSAPHTVTTVEQGRPNSPSESFDSGHIIPKRGTFSFGGSFFHTFDKPGVYEYFCTLHPFHEGRIIVGDTRQAGQNGKMNMVIGANLPFNATELQRVLLSITPSEEVADLPPTTALTYKISISSPVTSADIVNQTLPAITNEPPQNVTSVGDSAHPDEIVYSSEFLDTDGVLYLELIPEPAVENVTTGFVTWGPDISATATGPHTGAFHIKGPVLVEEKPYTMTVDIVAIDNNVLEEPIRDIFILPSTIADSNVTDSTTGATQSGDTIVE